MMIMDYELRGNLTIFHAKTIAISLFICWMISRAILTREVLVRDFVRALYH
jgi:hypothetical protein